VTDCAQQPPTPTTRAGSSDLRRFASPRWAMKRLSADSRIEQVLKRITSASSRLGARRYPSDSSIPCIRSESCTFIWHPNVVTWYRLPLMRARLAREGGLFDRQGALHARFGMSGHGAEEGVFPRGEVGADRGLAVGDPRGD